MLTEMRLEECELDCALIGKRVRTARKAKKVTQEELSEHCGCTPTHICNLENGKIGVSLELLFKISIYLDKSMDYFVMDNENANPQIKIENNIAPKLKQCDTQMLEMVGSFIDELITYKEHLYSSIISLVVIPLAYIDNIFSSISPVKVV